MNVNEEYAVFKSVMVRLRDAENEAEGVLLDSLEVVVLTNGIRRMSDENLRGRST